MNDLAERLRDAERRAEELFAAIEAAQILRPGVTESSASARIHELAADLFGIRTWWHRRIVRVGANTLLPYFEHPPDLVLGDDDIAFVDLGPVFEQWEADFGKTYVMGSDPHKLRLRDDTEAVFARGRAYFESDPACTGAALYAFMQDAAREAGWELGGEMAGHLVGRFPHARIPGDKVLGYIHPDNPFPLRGVFDDGTPRYWILESHLVDRGRGFGGFFEALLNA